MLRNTAIAFLIFFASSGLEAQDNFYNSTGDLLENSEPTISIEVNALGQAVWSERYPGFSRASEIYFFDGTSVIPLTSNGSTNAIYSVFPKINDLGQAVWRTTISGVGSDIWFYDTATGELSNLTPHLADSNHPDINNQGEVVFAAREVVPDPADIYLWKGPGSDLAEPVNAQQAGIQVFPRITDQGDIVWLTDGSGDTWEAWSLDRSTEEPEPSTILEDATSSDIKVLSNLLLNTCQTFANYEQKAYLFVEKGSLNITDAENLVARVDLLRDEIGCP